MKTKRIIKRIAVLLSIMMVLSMLVPAYVSAETSLAPTIKISAETVKPGETSDVSVELIENPGIVSATLSVSFDKDALTLTAVKDMGLLGTQSHKDKLVSPYSLVWVNDTATENFNNNGVIAVLTFKVNENAAQKAYPIKVSYDFDNYDIYDKDLKQIEFRTQDGSITVKSAETKPTESKPTATESKPTEPKSTVTESKPTEPKPTVTESKPTEPTVTEPSETKPTEPAVTEPTEPTATEPTVTTPTATEPTVQEPTEPVTEDKIDISDWYVEGLKNKTYNGKKQKQKLTVTDGYGVATVKVSYKNNKNAGTATVTITGTGDYEGTIAKTFKIKKAANPMKLSYQKKIVKSSTLRKKSAVVIKIVPTGAAGKVTYTVTKQNKRLSVNSKGQIIAKKGTKKGTYTIKIKISAKGNSNYKSLSKNVTFKIKVS